MDSLKQLQAKLDTVFENGAIFTYRMSGGASATHIASKAWALRKHENTVLVGIVFATIPRHWIHRVSKVQEDGEGFVLSLPNGKSVRLQPVNTKFVDPSILEKIKNDDRIKQELNEEVDKHLEANPQYSLENF